MGWLAAITDTHVAIALIVGSLITGLAVIAVDIVRGWDPAKAIVQQTEDEQENPRPGM